jgi:hypothetical protein
LGYTTSAAVVTQRVPSQDVVFAVVVMPSKTRVVRSRNTIHALGPEAGQQGFQL